MSGHAVLGQHTIGITRVAFHVGQQRVADALDAALAARLPRPREVGELAVDADAEDVGAQLVKLIQAVGERQRVRWVSQIRRGGRTNL